MSVPSYPKQPTNPNRKPEQSVTWVRNLSKLPKIVVVLPPGSKNPIPKPKPKP